MTIYDTREGTRLVLNQQKRGHWNRWGRFYRSGLGVPFVQITVLTEKRGVTSRMTMPGQGRIAGMKTASRESATVINTFVSPSDSHVLPVRGCTLSAPARVSGRDKRGALRFFRFWGPIPVPHRTAFHTGRGIASHCLRQPFGVRLCSQNACR
jgi:hypothetical protein